MTTIENLTESISKIKISNNVDIDVDINKVYDYLQSNLNQELLQDISNKCKCINSICSGDGSGLLGGSLIDMFLCKYFKQNLSEFQENHHGESDMKICDIPFSLKKINGKKKVALDWSKNNIDSIKREYFNEHIIIINLKTEQWWKTKPLKVKTDDDYYKDIIKSGFYIVDKEFCKNNIKLTSNNKSNSIVEEIYVYKMLKRSIELKTFIEIPNPNIELEFDILKAFQLK